MALTFLAMQKARALHRDQRRRYTGEPYVVHLAEVAGTVAAALAGSPFLDTAVAVAWLHDSIEDTETTFDQLARTFDLEVADGVRWLTDCEPGNRATRKRLTRERLANAPGWVQTVKVADLLSNGPSIARFDPGFAWLYVREARALLDEGLTQAVPELRDMLSHELFAWGEIAKLGDKHGPEPEVQVYGLKALREATDEAIEKVRPLAIEDAVNWADLSCCEARRCIDDQGRVTHEVLIEEASPGASELRGAVRRELRAAGFPGVDVVTEW